MGILVLRDPIVSEPKTNDKANTHSDGWFIGFEFSEVKVLDEVYSRENMSVRWIGGMRNAYLAGWLRKRRLVHCGHFETVNANGERDSDERDAELTTCARRRTEDMTAKERTRVCVT